VVAKRLRRHFIGIERHPAYVEAAMARVRRTKPISIEGATSQPTKREAPRIPFGSLVEQGLIAPGTIVFDRQRRVSAMVGPDGSLSAGDIRGSIHKVGAMLQNVPSCNGWTFWHFERDGTLVPLDALRSVMAARPMGITDPLPA
jgi:modification methylase